MPTSSSCTSSENDVLSTSDTAGSAGPPSKTGGDPSSVVNCTRVADVSATGEFDAYLFVAVSASPSSCTTT